MRLIDGDALIADCQLAQKQAGRHGREFANAFYSGGGDISTEWWCVEDMIENAPTIEPECKTGRWLYDEERCATGIYAICSACDESIYQTGNFRYCPNCGARMEETE